MASIRIEKLSPQLCEAYDEFLRRHPQTLFYYCSSYKNFLQALLGCGDNYLLALEGETIRGGLPLLFMEFEGKRVYNSLPFYGSNGGIVADNMDAGGSLTAAYRELADHEQTISATIVNNPFAGQDSAGLPHNFTDQRIAQFTRLTLSGDAQQEIMSRIDSSARRNINKAQREGVTVEIDHAQMDRLREMHQANMRAIGGLAKSHRFFELIPQHFKPGNEFDLYVAKKDGAVVAALLLFYFNQTVEYITPAIDAEFRSFQPLSLILMKAMADAARRGFTWWNWGGTWNTQMGVYRFKKKWGADERRYTYYTQLNDTSILEWPQERILKTFPNFYVAPFSALVAERKANV